MLLYLADTIMLTRDQRGHMVPPYLEYRAAVYLSSLFWWSPGAGWDYYPAPGSFQSIKNCKQWPLVPLRAGTDYCKYHHCWLFSIITVRPLPGVFKEIGHNCYLRATLKLLTRMDHKSGLTEQWASKQVRFYFNIWNARHSGGYRAATEAGMENYPTNSFSILDFPHQE